MPPLVVLFLRKDPKSCEFSRGISGLGRSTSEPAVSLLQDSRNFRVGAEMKASKLPPPPELDWKN